MSIIKCGGVFPKFLHLTGKDLGRKTTLKPKIPKEPFEDEFGCIIEDNVTPRISFATSIDCALLALKYYAPYDVYYIYGTNKLNGYYVPRSLKEDDNAVLFLTRSGLLKAGFNFEYDCDDLIKEVGEKTYNNAFKGIVPDADITGEVWAKKATPVEFVGKLILSSSNE